MDKIKEPLVINLNRFVDDRGVLDALFNDDLPFTAKRAYFIITPRGVIRGMHGHKAEWKALYVTAGHMKVVVSDMQLTHCNTFSLSDKLPQLLVIPNNLYHGFMSLSEETRVLILSSATLDESKKDDYRLSPHKNEMIMESFKVVDR